MACTCSHPHGSHPPLAGVRDETGAFLSRCTAEYPEQLATQFAKIILPLVSGSGKGFSLSELMQSLPIKGTWDPPIAQVDGAGFHSRPDWSHPNSMKQEAFKEFRQHWLQRIAQQKLHKEITQHFAQQRPEPPFSDELVAEMRSSIGKLLEFHNMEVDWTTPPNQPLCLHILQALSRLSGDPDIELFQHLIDGVPTGFQRNIPPHCFEGITTTTDDPPPLSVHFDGWKSAHDDPGVTTALVQEELRQGWVFEFPGTLMEAQEQYPVGVSVGKLGVATSSSRPPRLVVDSAICGLNLNCPLPERGSLPSAKDVTRSFPLRQSSAALALAGLSLDVKSAHKRVAIHPSEHGLVGFSWQNKIYFYKVWSFRCYILSTLVVKIGWILTADLSQTLVFASLRLALCGRLHHCAGRQSSTSVSSFFGLILPSNRTPHFLEKM